MQKELNHKVRKCFNEGIYNVARYTEIVLSIIILIVIALAGIRLIFTCLLYTSPSPRDCS